MTPAEKLYAADQLLQERRITPGEALWIMEHGYMPESRRPKFGRGGRRHRARRRAKGRPS